MMPCHCTVKSKWIGMFRSFGFDLLRSAGVVNEEVNSDPINQKVLIRRACLFSISAG